MAILFEDIGPRIFYREDAAWEWRDEMGGRLFIPEEPNGEFYWFPMGMDMTTALGHRLHTGLNGWMVTSREELAKMSG
jgi:hypothetical protein